MRDAPLLEALLRAQATATQRGGAARAAPRASCSRRPGCACAATSRSARSCPAASTRARWSPRWRSSSTGRSRRSRSASTSRSSTRPRYAREVAELYGTEHHEFRVEPHAIEVLPRLVWHYGEPFADQSAIPSFYLAELTRRARHGRAQRRRRRRELRRLPALRRATRLADRLAWVPQPARAAGRSASSTGSGPGPRPRSSRTPLQAARPRARDWTPTERYAMWIAYFTEADRAGALHARASAPRSASGACARGHAREPYRASDADNLVERLLDVDVQTLPARRPAGEDGHRDDGPLARGPLAAARPPASWRWRPRLPAVGEARRDDDQADLQGRAAAVAARPHPRPARRWASASRSATGSAARLRDLPGEILLDPRSLERGLFREERLRRSFGDHVAGSSDHSNKIWALLQLELWLRMWVDDVPASTPLSLTIA